MKGNAFPELRLSRLTKAFTKFTRDAKLMLIKMFGEDAQDTDHIEWEGQIGSRGLTPFANEDAEAPRTSPVGSSAHEAYAAFWKEKMYFGASFLNNLRQVGSKIKKMRAKTTLAKGVKMLRNRCDRRKEWMIAQMLAGNGFTYENADGKKITVDYGIPTGNRLTASTLWTASNPTILNDFLDVNLLALNNNSGAMTHCLMTTEILHMMIKDTGIQGLAKKSAFGDGALFARPREVLSSLLNIPNLTIYDEAYQVISWLTAAVSAGADPTISVDSASDYEVGATLTIQDVSQNTTETLTIASVDEAAGTIGTTGTLSSSYKANEDRVYMTKKFLPTNKIVFFQEAVEGNKIAEFINSPFDMDEHIGAKIDRHFTWDPDGVFIRVQNKGLPVLYHEDAVITFQVAA